MTTAQQIKEHMEVVGSDGQATRDLPVSREYLLRGELAGTYPSTMRIFLAADRRRSK